MRRWRLASVGSVMAWLNSLASLSLSFSSFLASSLVGPPMGGGVGGCEVAVCRPDTTRTARKPKPRRVRRVRSGMSLHPLGKRADSPVRIEALELSHSRHPADKDNRGTTLRRFA